MVPYVLGFTPVDSLVMVALVGQRKRLGACLRLDLPHGAADGSAVARYLVGVASAHRFGTVLLVAFTSDERRAAQVMQPLRRGLALGRITVADALRADGKRWWSYTCHDPACCSPGGTPYDPDSTRVAAEAVVAGLTRAHDRDSLRTQLEPLSEPARLDTLRECTARAAAIKAGDAALPCSSELDALLRRHLAAPGDMPAADTATLLLAMQNRRLRDAAWAGLSRTAAADQLELWRHVMRTAPDGLLAPVGALAGFAAWLAGQGALAWHAVERVESVSPSYPMCVLLRGILDAALSPDVWDELPERPGPGSWE
ncbi:MAG: hypothetical protein QOK30_606 [Nocardioidaceae bacterium]|jgi:hypothetical protein|nr:hypothetical protein [Nocardioidaceae bacterium]